jgi:hypothetical protein
MPDEMPVADGRRALLSVLQRLIRRDRCVLAYDCDLIDALPAILREQHEIVSLADMAKNAETRELIHLLRQTLRLEIRDLESLPSLLRSTGVNLDEFGSKAPEGLTGTEHKLFDRWSKVSANESKSEVLALQTDLAMGKWNASRQRYSPNRDDLPLPLYLISVTTAPRSLLERALKKSYWELWFAWWKMTGRLNPLQPSLSVGPRWLKEIAFFRQVVGLSQHVGLDLFSDDPALVVAGDMHGMPFEDNHFHFMFVKNTVDKSYNVRKLVTELLRVARPGATIVIDQICAYGVCSPLNRTDIQSAQNLLRLFEAYGQVKPLVCDDVDVSGLGDARERNELRRNARLAITVSKGPAE